MSIWASEKGTYATIWKLENMGNYVRGTISTSSKNPDETRTWSNWNCKYLGKCKDRAVELKERDRINITSGKIENVLFGTGENRKSYLNFLIFDFEILDGFENTGNTTGGSTSNTVEDGLSEDDLPF